MHLNRLLIFIAAGTALAAPEQTRTSYVLGPDDQITIRVPDAEEISEKPVRIDMSGYFRLPLVGRIKAGGRTLDQLEGDIATRLKSYMNSPDVAVSITEFRSQPVSVLGSVKTPGVHQLQGRKTLIEILSLAGGLSEDAGYSLKITRRIENGPIPLKSAVEDATGKFTIAEVSLKSILNARNPEENIIIEPYDVVSIPRAEMIYVTGHVQKPGGYTLHERESLSVLQVLSLAGGLERAAAPQNVRILRPAAGASARQEIPVDMKRIMLGKADDVPLQADDILFVPASAPKNAAMRAMEAAIQVGTGIAVYRR
jgi:polysaccharide export outer membrane protein